MSTRLLVMNEAARHLGEPPMNDPDEDGNLGRTLRDAWPSSVKSCFEQGQWNFAQKRIKLEKIQDKPVYGFCNYYQLPADHMRTVFMSEWGFEEGWLNQFSEESGKIATDAQSLYLRYISETYVARVGDWPQVFADFVSADLASRTQPRLNSTTQAFEVCAKNLKRRKSLATTFDAQQNPPARWAPGSWVRARSRGNPSGSYDPSRGR